MSQYRYNNCYRRRRNVSDIMLTDITIDQARCPVFLRIGNRGRVVPGTAKPKPGKLHRILIENVKGKRNFRQGSFISGIPGYLIEDVCIRNFKIEMQGGGTADMVNQIVGENEAAILTPISSSVTACRHTDFMFDMRAT